MAPTDDPLLLDRWHLIRLLSDHEEGCVVLAEDRQAAGARRAVKVFRVASSRHLDDVRREFAILRRLRHPAVARAFELVVWEGGTGPARRPPPAGEYPFLAHALAARSEGDAPRLAFLSFEHSEGLDLRQAFLQLFPQGDIGQRESIREASHRWRAFLDGVARVCLGLEAVHQRGLVHYDIKPENILLDPEVLEASGGRAWQGDRFGARLIDFGLSELETTPLGPTARGTVPFIAPEILSGDPVDRRSDLFSLGVAIASSLSGHCPFPGATPAEQIENARRGRILRLKSPLANAPRGLDVLLERLLSPDPRKRPGSALAVAAELASMGGFELPAIASTGHAPVVGLERIVASVEQEIDALVVGESSIAGIVVEHGTQHFVAPLVEEVESLALARGVLSIHCSASSPTSHAYAPFADAIRQISCRHDLDAPRWRSHRHLLDLFLAPAASREESELPESDHSAPLGVDPLRVDPLRRLDAQDVSEFVDRLSELLLEFAAVDPLLIILREVQLADPSTIAVLRSLARKISPDLRGADLGAGEPPSRKGRLLIFATRERDESSLDGRDLEEHTIAGRSSESAASMLEPVEAWRSLEIENLTADRVRDWMQARKPRWSPSPRWLDRAHEVTGGAPRALDEIVRGVGERLESKWPASTADLDLEELGSMPIDRRIEESLAARAARLEGDERVLLDIFVAAGRRNLDIRALDRALEGMHSESPTPPDARRDVRSRLEHLEDLAFLERMERIDGDCWTFAHEPGRRQLWSQMPETRRVELHRQLAMASTSYAAAPLAETGAARVHHLEGAGDIRGAIEACQLAAERARRVQALDMATSLYERALELVARATPLLDAASVQRVRLSVNRELVAIDRACGRYARALDRLTALLAIGDPGEDLVEQGLIYRQMGELHDLAGSMADGGYFLEKAVSVLEDEVGALRRAGGPDSARLPGIVHELCRALLLLGAHTRSVDVDEALRRFHSVRAYLETLDNAHALWSDLHFELTHTHRLRDEHGRSLSAAQAALLAAEAAGDELRLLRCRLELGSAHTSRGDLDVATDLFRKGLELAESTGRRFAASDLLTRSGTVYHNQGDHQRALECYARSSRISHELDDRKGVATSYNNLGNVFGFRDQAERAAECYRKAISLFARLGDQNGMAVCMTNLSGVLEQQGSFGDALEYAHRAVEKRKSSASKSGLAFSYYRIGKIYQAKGELDKALQYAERGLGLRQELDDRMGVAYSHLQIAEISTSRGKLFEAYQRCQEGTNEFERIDNTIGMLHGRELRARILLQVGRLDEARELFEETLERARTEEQRGLEGDCLLGLGTLLTEQGHLAEARDRLEAAERLFRQTASRRRLVQTLLYRGQLDLDSGRPDASRGHIEEAYSVLESLGIRDLVPYYFLLRAQLEASQAQVDDEVTDASPSERGESSAEKLESVAKYLQRGLLESEEANLESLTWRLHLEAGRIAERRGDSALARVHFAQSRAVLDTIYGALPLRFRQTFYLARDKARVLQYTAGEDPGATETASPAVRQEETAKSGAATESDSRRALPNRQPVAPPTPPLYTEFLKLHEVITQRQSASKLADLFELILDAVIDLVRAERGFLILSGEARDDGEPVVIARNFDQEEISEPDGKLSHTVAQQVIDSGTPVHAGNALSDRALTSARSVRELRLRSILCVPLQLGDRVLGALYVDNRHRRDAFDDQNLRTLQAFADQAAIGITTLRLLGRDGQTRAVAATDESPPSGPTAHRVAGQEKAEKYSLDQVVGGSSTMREVLGMIAKVAPSDATVLLTGESGTGKELLARCLHFNSARRDKPFISENCGALTETLLESELFGHVAGAFTGATRDQEGLICQADGGTLLLDEVGDMSLAMQKKMLRVLQQGEVRPVGADRSVPVDVRFLAASNADLRAAVERGEFREDLYYRLHVVQIDIPPLRKRREDIEPLLESFFRRTAKRWGCSQPRLSPDAVARLVAWHWPGNVRELRHFVERTLLVSTVDVLEPEHLVLGENTPCDAADESPSTDGPDAQAVVFNPDGSLARFRDARNVFERLYVESALKESDGNVAQASKLSGLSRESFYRLLRKHGVERR